jgi:type IV secretory pathway VirB10-like protein
LIERAYLTHRLVRIAARRGRLPALALVLAAGLAGCRHKNMPVAFPQLAHAPLELEIPSPSTPPIMIAEVPPPELGPPLLPPPPPPAPRRRTTPSPKEETQPPVQVAEAAPAELAIGTLSTGGDLMPQSQQEAQDMISSILKRISALSTKTAESQKRQIRQVRYFLKQAQQALSSGDAEGAKNLAIKARLLMDDLEKK